MQRYESKTVKFSVIVPSYNEEQDIEETLTTVCSLEHQSFEVLVIDDSDDRTPEILKAHPQKNRFKTYKQKTRLGLNGAYNLGVEKSVGEIVVLLTADNRPSPNYLQQIEPYFDAGADYIVVKSFVENQWNKYAEFVQVLQELNNLKKSNIPKWSEGFSVRRNAYLKVGGLPNIEVVGGTDNLLAERLAENDFQKAYAPEIIMSHIAPSSYSEWADQQTMRGEASVQYNMLINKQKRLLVFFKLFVKYMIFIIKLFSIFWYPFQGFLCTHQLRYERGIRHYTIMLILSDFLRLNGERLALRTTK